MRNNWPENYNYERGKQYPKLSAEEAVKIINGNKDAIFRISLEGIEYTIYKGGGFMSLQVLAVGEVNRDVFAEVYSLDGCPVICTIRPLWSALMWLDATRGYCEFIDGTVTKNNLRDYAHVVTHFAYRWSANGRSNYQSYFIQSVPERYETLKSIAYEGAQKFYAERPHDWHLEVQGEML